MFIDFYREGKREAINDWLSPACALTGDQTCNLSVYGTTLQLTDTPSQGPIIFSIHCCLSSEIIRLFSDFIL